MKKTNLMLVLLTAGIALFSTACSSAPAEKDVVVKFPAVSQSTSSTLSSEDGIISSEAEIDTGEATTSSTTDQEIEWEGPNIADSIPDSDTAVEPDLVSDANSDASDISNQSNIETTPDNQLPPTKDSPDLTIGSMDLYLKIPEEELTPEQKEFLQQMQETNFFVPGNSAVESSGSENNTQSEPVSTQTTRTDAEVKETINSFVDNFKNTSTFTSLVGVAAEYADENLDTLKNNPESSASLKEAITMYKEGLFSEEQFVYTIEKWIRIGGPYGGQTITVQ